MSLRVFHPPGSWAAGQRLTLDGPESRYLIRVRRARPGATLELLDGQSACWRAQLVEVQGRHAVLELLEPCPSTTVRPLELLLVLPHPADTLEAIAVASELGATAIWLVPGDHTPQGTPSLERVARILAASQRQCGRPCPPQIHGPTALASALAETAARPGYVASVPDRLCATPVAVNPTIGARLLVGPEGGLSPAEQQMAADAGLRPLGLGPWVLRAPTAVAAGLARLQGPPEGDPDAGSRPYDARSRP